MPDQEGIDRSIAETEKELVRLNIKREELIARLQDLRREKTLLAQSGNQIALSFQPPAVTNRSSEEEKITLFQSLFKGRADVYPRRFESVKTGRSGYSPACANEWATGICHKPRIKCTEFDVLQRLKPLDSWGQAETAATSGRLTSPSPAADAPAARIFNAAFWSLLRDQPQCGQ